MHDLRSEAIILRRTNYGEADRITTFVTPDHGKLTAIAKGVRKPKSKLAGGLELFATCELTIRKGRGDMGTITSARLQHFYGAILRDYDRMQLGYDCIKLINRVSETIGEPAFYELLHRVFICLDQLTINHQLIEVWFRLNVMNLLGTGLNLVATYTGQPLAERSRYNFDFDHMSFVQHPDGRFDAGHIKLLRLLNAKDPTVVQQIGGIETFLADCLWLTRTVEW